MPYAPGPRSARPTGSTASSASGRLRRKVGMVEMIRLADEPWAPVAQGHTGAEVVRSVRVALRGTNAAVQPAAGEEVSNSETPDPPLGCNGLFVVFGCHKGRFEAACRRAASCAIANTSPSNRSEISNRISWISSIVLSAFVGFIA